MSPCASSSITRAAGGLSWPSCRGGRGSRGTFEANLQGGARGAFQLQGREG